MSSNPLPTSLLKGFHASQSIHIRDWWSHPRVGEGRPKLDVGYGWPGAFHDSTSELGDCSTQKDSLYTRKRDLQKKILLLIPMVIASSVSCIVLRYFTLVSEPHDEACC